MAYIYPLLDVSISKLYQLLWSKLHIFSYGWLTDRGKIIAYNERLGFKYFTHFKIALIFVQLTLLKA